MQLRRGIVACATLMAFLTASIGGAKGEDGIKEGARNAGRAVGSATRDVWEGAKKTGKEIGHGATKAAKAVGGAAKEGAHELKRAFKGEK